MNKNDTRDDVKEEIEKLNKIHENIMKVLSSKDEKREDK